MENDFSNEPMLDIFIYETEQNIEQLEKSILSSEESSGFTADTVNEIFRIMHTIKGSAAMMLYNNIAEMAHAMEDLFYFMREEKPEDIDNAALSDLVLEGVDFVKAELEKARRAAGLDGDPARLIENIKAFLRSIKGDGEGTEAPRMRDTEPERQQYYLSGSREGSGPSDAKAYEAVVFFEDGCEMENIRAYAIVHGLKDIAEHFSFYPEDIIENNESVNVIRDQGFRVVLRSDRSYQELFDFFRNTAFVRDLELAELDDDQASEALGAPQAADAEEDTVPAFKTAEIREQTERVQVENRASHQSIISVDVAKLDKLMDLMGEMVIAESMVTQNPELRDIKLNGFHKAARQLQKITGEMQDMIMSIRMVPLSATFHKMHRIVRDMSRKLGKEVRLELIGTETEVDKNIIEHISDPLMHLVRNSIDHGIEDAGVRAASGKPRIGQVTLEAKNAGSDVLIIVRDDGRGLSKEKILKKAMAQGIISRTDDMTDREIYGLIFHPGFSTNENVTEFSGRGVGMDVVARNIAAVGGSVLVDSVEGAGTVTTLKIPLTLAIIDGMNIRVGDARYTLPTISIKESFRAAERDILKDPDGNEMIMVRGQCYPILRLHKMYAVETDVTDFTQGIMLMVEQDGRSLCLFADELIGQYQVVVKALPDYIVRTRKIDGIAGCTLLGDGSISLILNIGRLVSMKGSVSGIAV